MAGSVEMNHEEVINAGPLMEATFAIMKPYSKTGIKMRGIYDRTHSSKGIQLSRFAALWLSRKVLHVG